ncbi:hypothetical protein BGZ94_010297 [Podila epigama]|nr:hypothetical protein BGZ94_010297 [Podila epigama]
MLSSSTKLHTAVLPLLWLCFWPSFVLSSCCYSFTSKEIRRTSDYHDRPPTSYSIALTATSQNAIDKKAYHVHIRFPSNYVISHIPDNCVSVSIVSVNCTSTYASTLSTTFSSVIAADVSDPSFESVQVNGETCTRASTECPELDSPTSSTSSSSSSTSTPSSSPFIQPVPIPVPESSRSPVPLTPTFIPGEADAFQKTTSSQRTLILSIVLPLLALIGLMACFCCVWRRRRRVCASPSSSSVGIIHHQGSTFSVDSDPFMSRNEKSEKAYEHIYHAYANEKEDYPNGPVPTYRPANEDMFDAGAGTRPPQYYAEERPQTPIAETQTQLRANANDFGTTLVDISPPTSSGEEDDNLTSIVRFDHRSVDLTLMAPSLLRPAAALTTSGAAEISVDGDMNTMGGNNQVQRSKSIRYPFHQGQSITVTPTLQRSVSCASSLDSTKSRRLHQKIMSFQGPLHLQSEQVQEEQISLFQSPEDRQSLLQQKVPSPYSAKTSANTNASNTSAPSASLRPVHHPSTVSRSVSLMHRPSSLTNDNTSSTAQGHRPVFTSAPILLRPPKSVHRKPSRETLMGLSRSDSMVSSSSLSSSFSSSSRNGSVLQGHGRVLNHAYTQGREPMRSMSPPPRYNRIPPAPPVEPLSSASMLALSSSTRSLSRPGNDAWDADSAAALGQEATVVMVRPRQPKNPNEEELTNVHRRSGGIYGYV